jgi:autotransporter-associated beta strand protein
MNTLIVAAIRCSLMFLVPTATYAISTQWDLDPISGDWNTADNWTPNGVPNGPADTATFGLSHTTDVSISANTEVSGITFSSAATNPYTITANPGLTLTISGVGIVNNSGDTQNFVTTADASGNIGTIVFSHATAGSDVSISNKGGTTNFFESSADSVNFEGGTTNFFESSADNVSNVGGTTNFFESSADNVSNVGGTTNFFDRSTGSVSNFDDGTANFFDRSTGVVTNFGDGGANFFDRSTGVVSVSSVGGGVAFFDRSTGSGGPLDHTTVFFFDSSSAGGFVVQDSSRVFFFNNSTAANASFLSAGTIVFSDSSSAGNAFIGSSGDLTFVGASKGGTAQIELGPPFSNFLESIFDISGHNAPGLTIGSLAGRGKNTVGETIVSLGANNLTVGSNNLSTTFLGVIQDGGFGGSLTKIGSGTLILSGANTYTGDTNVNRGVLQVDGSITSNTFVNRGGTLAGTGTINANLTNNGKVSPGDSPGALTVVHNYTQAQYATLMIQIAGMSPDQFSALNVLGNANLSGFLDPVLLNGFVPTIGDSFTFLDYASLTGEFSQIKHQVFDNGMLRWSVIYEDNHAILTAAQNTPDQGSTFLLLTLGLLGLVTFRRQLLRGQP